MLPVAVKVPVAGLYSSALLRSPLPSIPPGDEYHGRWARASRCDNMRAVVMLPVAVKVPVAGLYSSALLR